MGSDLLQLETSEFVPDRSCSRMREFLILYFRCKEDGGRKEKRKKDRIVRVG